MAFTSLQEAQKNNQQLPASSYTDQNIFSIEMEEFYASGWMSIGFASRFSINDHSWSLEVLGRPLIVTRDSLGDLRVFHNVCRHRGHILVEQVEAAGKLLRCSYHSWCYGLDGKFVTAPFWDGSENSSPDEHQKSVMGLVPVEFATWYDVIFVNLKGDAAPFEEFINPLQRRWHINRPESELRCMSSRSFSVEGNWKLAAENFLDNYHLPWVHPQIGSSIEASLGLEVENLVLSEDIIGFSHPTAGSEKGKTSKPLPEWAGMEASETQRQDLFFLFPNTCFVMEGSYLWSMILEPKTVDQCDEQLALYVVDDSAMDDQFTESRKQLCDLIYQINSQDAKVIKNLQTGRQSEVASLGVYTPFHDELGKAFHQAVFKKLLASNSD